MPLEEDRMNCTEQEICSEKRIEEKEAYRDTKRESSFLWFSPIQLKAPCLFILSPCPSLLFNQIFLPHSNFYLEICGPQVEMSLEEISVLLSTLLLLSNRWPGSGQDHDDFGSQPFLLP